MFNNNINKNNSNGTKITGDCFSPFQSSYNQFESNPPINPYGFFESSNMQVNFLVDFYTKIKFFRTILFVMRMAVIH